MHSPDFIEEMKHKLHETKQRLQVELEGMSPHTEMGNESDENASEVSVDEVSQNVISRISKDLEKIDTALLNIESGVYGLDPLGQDISEERLRVIPWADTGV